jgi:hypothetical protein
MSRGGKTILASIIDRRRGYMVTCGQSESVSFEMVRRALGGGELLATEKELDEKADYVTAVAGLGEVMVDVTTVRDASSLRPTEPRGVCVC